MSSLLVKGVDSAFLNAIRLKAMSDGKSLKDWVLEVLGKEAGFRESAAIQAKAETKAGGKTSGESGVV